MRQLLLLVLPTLLSSTLLTHYYGDTYTYVALADDVRDATKTKVKERRNDFLLFFQCEIFLSRLVFF